jgi:DNA-binding CsgD family transcriptional regulator
MDQLRQCDLRRLLHCVHECNAIGEFDTFEQFLGNLVAALDRLIPAAHVTYNEMYPRKPESYNIASSSELSTVVAASLWQQHMNEHPILIHVASTGDHHTLRISDFWSQRQLRDSGLYDDFYRNYEIEDALCATISTDLPRVIGYGWHRDRRFTDRERTMADLIRPHVMQALQSARIVSEMRGQLQLLKHGLEDACVGVITCDADGRVQLMTSTARQYLAEYLGLSTGLNRRLPEELLSWVRFHLGAEDMPAPRPPLILRKEYGQLTIRLLSNGSLYMLLMEEVVTAGNVVTVAGPCLSQREAEVLDWVAQGKTNGEIAIILHISPLTVKKHLEHILQKLGVETRTAAAAMLHQSTASHEVTA